MHVVNEELVRETSIVKSVIEVKNSHEGEMMPKNIFPVSVCKVSNLNFWKV